jgi:hypothetical protein
MMQAQFSALSTAMMLLSVSVMITRPEVAAAIIKLRLVVFVTSRRAKISAFSLKWSQCRNIQPQKQFRRMQFVIISMFIIPL